MGKIKTMVIAIKRFPQIHFWPTSLYLAIGDPFGTTPIKIICKISNLPTSIGAYQRKSFQLLVPSCNWIEKEIYNDDTYWVGIPLEDNRQIIWPKRLG